MPAQASPYFAEVRTTLIVSCAICIAIPLCEGVSIFVEIVQHGDFSIRQWHSSIKPQSILVLELCSILIASCGLFGAWFHNLILTYIFATFLLLLTWLGILSVINDGYISGLFTFLFGDLLVLVIGFLVDLHKMKRTQKFESIPMEPVV